jgi:hypothetical protein
MPDPNYRPWRADDSPASGLNQQAADDWRSMLRQTAGQIAELHRLSEAMDQRLRLGAQLLRHLTALERRLAALESASTPPTFEHPSVGGPNTKAA